MSGSFSLESRRHYYKGEAMHHTAVEVLKNELESVQINRLYLIQGLGKMKNPKLIQFHGKIREDAVLRWERKLEDQTKRADSLLHSIQTLENLDKESTN